MFVKRLRVCFCERNNIIKADILSWNICFLTIDNENYAVEKGEEITISAQKYGNVRKHDKVLLKDLTKVLLKS